MYINAFYILLSLPTANKAGEYGFREYSEPPPRDVVRMLL